MKNKINLTANQIKEMAYFAGFDVRGEGNEDSFTLHIDSVLFGERRDLAMTSVDHPTEGFLDLDKLQQAQCEQSEKSLVDLSDERLDELLKEIDKKHDEINKKKNERWLRAVSPQERSKVKAL